MTHKKYYSAKLYSLQFSEQCLLCRNSHVMAYRCLVLWQVFFPAWTRSGELPSQEESVEEKVLQNEHKPRGPDVESSHRIARLLRITFQASHLSGPDRSRQ